MQVFIKTLYILRRFPPPPTLSTFPEGGGYKLIIIDQIIAYLSYLDILIHNGVIYSLFWKLYPRGDMRQSCALTYGC